MVVSTWTALADPTRRAILDLLRERPHAVGEVVSRLDLAQPTASKHLATLRREGLVRASVDAQRRVYSLDPRPIAELEAWLAPYRALWSDALDRLDAHLEDR
ncbi:transcriptional regulator [Actinomycetospora sp. NBRC 106378]|nr:transcriptional regulator [Actinomycetospora sp. NBRC 106378]